MAGDDNTPIRLVDHSGQMKHYSVVEMLEEVLADVKENPAAFQNAYLIMRENEADKSMNIHHVRAGFTSGYESLGYLTVAAQFRSDRLRGGDD